MVWITLAAVGGAIAGYGLRALVVRRLDERYGSLLWLLVPALAAVWGWLALRLAPVPLAVWLPFSVALAALAVVDASTRRLPDRVLLPAGLWVLAGAATAGVVGGDPRLLLVPLTCALVAGLTFWVLHLAGKAQLGFGDVKLASVLAAAVALVSWHAVAWALLGGCVLALCWALAARRKEVALGPWLCLSALAAVGLPV